VEDGVEGSGSEDEGVCVCVVVAVVPAPAVAVVAVVVADVPALLAPVDVAVPSKGAVVAGVEDPNPG